MERRKKYRSCVGVYFIHIPDGQFIMIRYYGIYAHNTKDRPRLIKMVNEKIKEIRRKMRNWRTRIMKTFGYDPIECEKCGGLMEPIEYEGVHGEVYRIKGKAEDNDKDYIF